ncbi:MAG: FlgD immunoglobulin-like domain containing protein [bacterium]
MKKQNAGGLARAIRIVVGVALAAAAAPAAAQPPEETWRYYRPGNTGIQGDYCDAIWLDDNGDPWIGGYDASFEEGGVSKFVQAENRWINISNIDYPVIGHPNLTGTTRVSDFVEDAQGRLWMSTWRSVLRFDPAVGPSSLVNFASASPAIANGGCRDLEISPDGKIWFALLGFGGSSGGIVRHTPGTTDWHYWTGGNPPQGGNNWPILVWNVYAVEVQPKPGGGYIVWGDADNGASVVAFDSDTNLWTYYEFSFTPGSMLGMPGRENLDDSGNLWMTRFVQFNGGTAVYSLDYRRSDGTWVTPAQPPIPGGNPSIWAFRAFGDREALLADGNGRIWRFNGTSWLDLGIWRAGGYTYDLEIDAAGTVWASGTGGAARRDAGTGVWQRYRVTNTSQYDSFNTDLALDPATGRVWACANAGPGYGGATMFDGERWTGFNNYTYGLGVPWPFPTDNSQAVGFRPSNGNVSVNPTYGGIHQWNGANWTNLNGMSESRGLVEDSNGRLWSLGNYFELRYHNGLNWVSVPNNGTWGNNIQMDPDRAGTVWVSTYAEVIRTDGAYRFSRDYTQFPELDTQSDIFGTVAAGPDGIAWLGSTQGVFKLDASTGSYEYFEDLGGISCIGASPWAVTPDGRVWFGMFDPGGWGGGPNGLCWFDGVNSGYYPAPVNGEPQWGGLPHAQIRELQVREIPGAYELWMVCASRGIAVLTIPFQNPVAVDEGLAAPSLALLQNSPNPFRSSTTLHFSLPRPQEAQVSVFDVSGRLVRTLVDRRLAGGEHQMTWDGTDQSGRAVTSGTYFYKLITPERNLTRKMSVIR